MSVNINVVQESNITELTKKQKEFKCLEKATVRAKKKYLWNDNEYIAQVIVIGKSGYGKSTTLNKIIGKDVFETDDVCACTKELYSAKYHLKKNKYIQFSDLPGIGESEAADKMYEEWYELMISKSTCILYILRADQRDFTVDEKIFNKFFKTQKSRKNVIIALNCADKIEPINRDYTLSDEQILNLDKKMKEIKEIFNVNNVIYYSAANNINVDKLMLKIIDAIKSQSRRFKKSKNIEIL